MEKAKTTPRALKGRRNPTKEDIGALRLRLREAEETLEAIRSGSVDAIVVSGDTGERVFTLQGADHNYRLLVESIHEGVVTISPGGTVLYSNSQFARLLGYPLERIIGAPFRDHVSAGDCGFLDRVFKEGVSDVPRSQILLKSSAGAEIPVQVSLSDSDMSGAGTITAVVTDLSEHLRYREILQEEKLSQAILEQDPNGVAVCDRDGRIIRCSRALSAFCDGMPLWRLFDEAFDIRSDNGDTAPEKFSTAFILEGHSLRSADALLLCFDGRKVPVRINASPLNDANAEIIGSLITLTDITEKKQAEERLKRSEREYRHIVEGANSIILKTDRDLKITFMNPFGLDYFGYAPAEIIGRRAVGTIIPARDSGGRDLEAMAEDLQRRPEHYTTNVHQNLRKDRRLVWVSWANRATRDEQGNFTELLAVGNDLSRLMEAEEALRAKERRIGSILESITDIYIAFDPEHRFVDLNRKAEQMIGHNRQEAIGRTVLTLFPELAGETYYRQYLEAVSTQRPDHIEALSFRGRWYEAHVYPSPERTDIYFREITERKLAEENLRQQTVLREEAYKELESFSYSVSHDLRAPLRAIEGYARMVLKKENQFQEETLRQLHVIRDNTLTMGRLIEKLLDFSRLGRQSIALTTVDMEGLCREVWEELVSIDAGRQMEFKLASLPPALGDQSLLKQVYGNLLSNAIKFTQRRETALIEAGSTLLDGENVYFIRDNGVGFDMAYRDKLFGVFQRLHSAEEFEGTGVGLATVQRIIKRHGGRIWAEGATDRGATFYFTLPGPDRATPVSPV